MIEVSNMSYVNVSEVGTFRSALDLCGYHRNIKIPYLTALTKHEMNDNGCMVPTETLGRLWNATSSILPVEYALQVAEVHTETTKVYGEWGEVMDVAVDIGDRLKTGISLMPAHTDDPKWELADGDGAFYLIRNWNYANTLFRAEAFASISEFREWLIVMQRHIRQPVQPMGIELTRQLYQALESDELHHVARFFGCDVRLSGRNSIIFPSCVLDYPSERGDPEKLVALRSELMKGISQNIVRFKRRRSCGSCLNAELQVSGERECADNEPGSSTFLSAIDIRHREALSLATKDGADYIAELGRRSSELCGIDIGGGFLEVTEVFLRRLASKAAARIKLSVVDPELSHIPRHLCERRERIEKELGAQIELKGMRWLEYASMLPAGSRFDFAVAFQLLSLLPSDEVERTFTCLRDYLGPGGRFFAVFEPYDRVTLAKYDSLRFYQRPVEWYREVARRAGFIPGATTVHTAHEGEPSSALVCFRFVKSA